MIPIAQQIAGLREAKAQAPISLAPQQRKIMSALGREWVPTPVLKRVTGLRDTSVRLWLERLVDRGLVEKAERKEGCMRYHVWRKAE